MFFYAPETSVWPGLRVQFKFEQIIIKKVGFREVYDSGLEIGESDLDKSFYGMERGGNMERHEKQVRK